jgi:alpha-L-rhamnosidase
MSLPHAGGEPASFTVHRRSAPWLTRSAWPCSWISGGESAPTVGAYRLEFTLDRRTDLRLIVSADERYRLYLDGELLGSGPELGTRWRWQADVIEAAVEAGRHLLLAVVWSVGDEAGDFATDGIRHGFALGVDGPLNAQLATGLAHWEWHRLPGYVFRKSTLAHWTVPDLHRDAAACDWEAEEGGGTGWQAARAFSPVHHVADVEIHPARLVELGTLPRPLLRPWNRVHVRHAEVLPGDEPVRALPLGEDDAIWRQRATELLAAVAPLSVPPRTRLRLVLDCDDYLTAWPELSAAGAAGRIGIEWMEALSEAPITGPVIPKGLRDGIAGRYAHGLGDHVVCDAGMRRWRPLYWRSGRFVIVTIEAADEPVVISSLRLVEERYPLESEGRLALSDPGLMAVLPLCLRTLQVNAHDQFSDTPYYERMQYLGDCRIDCLNTYVLSHDRRLVAKALRMADAQRLPDGLTVSRTPTRNLQVIPPFSLFYVGMVRDYLWWHGDLPLVTGLMPGVRAILDAFLRHLGSDDVLGPMPGWHFCDWTSSFPNGEPPGTEEGSAPGSLQLLMALGWAEELESALGERELAARWRRWRRRLAGGIRSVFWDARRGLWADDRSHRSYSQHAQALAMLARGLPRQLQRRAVARMERDRSLAGASMYFTHYLIEAWAATGKGDEIRRALDFWAALPAQGFRTMPEAPEPSRSDCHAWCAHPLFHTAATLAGIRPAAPSFASVRIAPCLGPIPGVSVRIPHPAGGWIEAEFEVVDGGLRGRVDLPVSVSGILTWAGRTQVLVGGCQDVRLPNR